MTQRQKVIILGICIAPILIGLWIILSDNTGFHSPISLKKIGLVQITDVITESDSYVKQLRTFREDDAIAGVLLRIDSPGGASAPSQEIFKEVYKFRECKKPVFVSVGNMAASGGYYIASAASKIFANPSSITGSIGAIVEFPQYNKLLEKIGVSMRVIKSGEMKDIGSPQRDMTAKDKQLFQGIVGDIYEQFLSDVCLARSLNIDSIRPIADGRIFTGAQALKLGLIDTLGGYEDASDYLKVFLNLPEKTAIVEKKPKESYLRSLLFGELVNKFPFLKNSQSPAGSYFLFHGGF